MTNKEQLDQFGEAVERKKEQSKAASEQAGEQPHGSSVSADQENIVSQGPQDTRDSRKKNAGKGKKTADKWNQ